MNHIDKCRSRKVLMATFYWLSHWLDLFTLAEEILKGKLHFLRSFPESIMQEYYTGLHKEWSFPLRFSLINVNKFAVSCKFISCSFHFFTLTTICAKYMRNIKKSSKVRQDRKTLISVIAYFLSASVNNLFLKGRLDTKLCLYAYLSFFYYSLIF